MRKTLAIIGFLAIALFSACSSSAPVRGKIVAEHFVPAHDGTVEGIIGYYPLIVGKVVIMQPIYGPVEQHWGDAWYLTVRDDKGHLYDVSVSLQQYNDSAIGSLYGGK